MPPLAHASHWPMPPLVLECLAPTSFTASGEGSGSCPGPFPGPENDSAHSRASAAKSGSCGDLLSLARTASLSPVRHGSCCCFRRLWLGAYVIVLPCRLPQKIAVADCVIGRVAPPRSPKGALYKDPVHSVRVLPNSREEEGTRPDRAGVAVNSGPEEQRQSMGRPRSLHQVRKGRRQISAKPGFDYRFLPTFHFWKRLTVPIPDWRGAVFPDFKPGANHLCSTWAVRISDNRCYRTATKNQGPVPSLQSARRKFLLPGADAVCRAGFVHEGRRGPVGNSRGIGWSAACPTCVLITSWLIPSQGRVSIACLRGAGVPRFSLTRSPCTGGTGKGARCDSVRKELHGQRQGCRVRGENHAEPLANSEPHPCRWGGRWPTGPVCV